MASLKARIFDKAAELGFCAWGIARADAAPEAGERLKQWIADGHHGEMGWIEERAEQWIGTRRSIWFSEGKSTWP